jgi:hypothetical protein
MWFEVNIFGWLWKFPNIQFPVVYDSNWLQYLQPFVMQNTLFSTSVFLEGALQFTMPSIVATKCLQ